MSARPLPDHPDLDQLRRQAKELRDAARSGDPDALGRVRRHAPSAPVTLSAAQLALAREHGFPSWPRLKAEVELRTLDLDRRVDAFLEASVEGRQGRAARLLEGDRRVATFDASTAAVLGEAEHLRRLIARDPAAATRPDGRRGWPPLLYVCHSRWHRTDPARAEGMLEVARMLLDAGASPDTSNGRPSRGGYRSALYGAAGIADNPALTRLLLERGADPNDDESLYHSAYHRDHACLRLLVEFGVQVNGTNALPALVGNDDAEGVRILLAAGADPGRRHDAPAPLGHLADMTLNPLSFAVAEAGPAVVEALLEAGADPNVPCRDGLSPVRTAARRGAVDVVDALLRHGAAADDTEVDRLLGACVRGDRAAAEAFVRGDPGLILRLPEEDQSLLVDAAEWSTPAAVALMLDLGFPVGAHRVSDGATALHSAAYMGRVDVVRMLLEHGAEVDALDRQFRSRALCWATVGSGEQGGRRAGDWVATVEALVVAGAALEGAWVPGKPPSDEVAALLVGLGVEEPGQPSSSGGDAPAAPAGVERVAEALRVAYETRDLGALTGLLHPEVRWGWGPGGCHTREQVLERFAVLHARGVRVEVSGVEVHGDSVVFALVGTLPGAGLHQVFRVADGLVVDIRGYADQEEALASIGAASG